MIRGIVNTDTATRLGIFNKIQQDAIITAAETLNLDKYLGEAIASEIEQQVVLWIRAMVAIVRIRTNAVKNQKRIREIDEKAAKNPQLPPPNIFDNFPREEEETPQQQSIISVLQGKGRIFVTYTQKEDYYELCDKYGVRTWTYSPNATPATPTPQHLEEDKDYLLQLWPEIATPNNMPIFISPRAKLKFEGPIVERSTADLLKFSSWRGISCSDESLQRSDVQQIINLTHFVNKGNFYKVKEWIIELEQYLKQTEAQLHKEPSVLLEIRFLYNLYSKLENMDVQNIDDDEGLFYQLSWDNELYLQMMALMRLMRKYAQVFKGTNASKVLTDIDIDFQSWETLSTNRRGMITIVEDRGYYTILYPERKMNTTRNTKERASNNDNDGIEHTTKSCQNEHMVQEGTLKISTFHRDATLPLRKTENAYRLHLLNLIQEQKHEYVETITMGNVHEKFKKFNRIKEQVKNIRTSIDRSKLSRAMNRKIKEALTSVLTKLKITDKVCSKECQVRVSKTNTINQYLIPKNPAEIGYSGKGD